MPISFVAHCCISFCCFSVLHRCPPSWQRKKALWEKTPVFLDFLKNLDYSTHSHGTVFMGIEDSSAISRWVTSKLRKGIPSLWGDWIFYSHKNCPVTLPPAHFAVDMLATSWNYAEHSSRFHGCHPNLPLTWPSTFRQLREGLPFLSLEVTHRLVAPDGLETMGSSPTPEILWTVKLERIILT
jgi:hypothetical protein